MEYRISDVVEETGVAPRTIREWIMRGMVKKPSGNGPAAVYDEQHVARIRVIARLRLQGAMLDDIKKAIARWSHAKCESWLAELAAAEAAAAAAEAGEEQESAAGEAPQIGPSPEQVTASLPPANGEPRPIERAASIDTSLPEGPRFVMASLLPGLALMVSTDAAPLVRRIAAEICDRYGTPR
jgi:DNA-binding transcriptional MerR regulator